MAAGSTNRGIALDLSFKNALGLVANLYAFDQDCQDAMRAAVQEAAEFCHEYAYEICPKDTHFMAEHIQVLMSPGGLVFEVGWLASDFESEGLAFYPLYVEFGTRFMDAQPTLYPAYQETVPILEASVSHEIQLALARRAWTTDGA